MHQAKLLPLVSVTATGMRYTSKGRGSSEETVLVLLMIYLFSNSYRNSNPFTLLPSPSTKVLNFFLDLLFFLFFSFSSFTECLLPNKQVLIKFFKVAISEQKAQRFAVNAFIFTKIYCQRAISVKYNSHLL